MADVLIQERRDLRLREEDIVKTEAEIEIMWPQAKGHLEPLEAGRDKEGFTPRTLRGSMPLP